MMVLVLVMKEYQMFHESSIKPVFLSPKGELSGNKYRSVTLADRTAQALIWGVHHWLV